jgi:hypothetical protein
MAPPAELRMCTIRDILSWDSRLRPEEGVVMNAWGEFVNRFRNVDREPAGAGGLKPLRPRVLLINFDPRRPTRSRQRLSRYLRSYWKSRGIPLQDVDDLVDGFIADVRECSSGLVEYQVVQSIVVDGWPAKKKDGFRYDWGSFVSHLNSDSGWFQPDLLDYDLVVREFGILHRIEAGQIDEVWLLGSGYSGFWESVMGGPSAFLCNSTETIHSPGVSRRFVIMGFNWERGVGEMLESLGHRVEWSLARAWRNHPGDENLWARFRRYDQETPGGANCGWMHYAPNSQRDYEWGSPRQVLSNCDDWLRFPNFQGTTRLVDCSEWGCPPNGRGEIRAHHKWWFKHLPRAAGQTLGMANNWWLYGIDPNAVG